MTYQGRFISAASGHLYLGCFGELEGRDVWLYLPPFAEEMNLSRAVVARMGRQLAARGEALVTLDYFGTGDSEGEFEQARLALWQQDVRDAVAWLQQQGAASISLWGLRFGGLLASSLLSELSPLRRLMLWKPVVDGKLMMTQFARLKQVAESLRGGEKTDWLQRIAAGETHEIAGYCLTPALLDDLQQLTLQVAEGVPPTLWLETGATVPPVAAAKAKLWPEGCLVQQAVAENAFWQNPDRYDAPGLIQAALDTPWNASQRGCHEPV